MSILNIVATDKLKSDALTVRFLCDEPGVIDAGASPSTAIVIHVGPSVEIACCRAGYHHQGVAVHGDVDIVPAGVTSRWENKQKDTALLIGVHDSCMQSAAEERGLDPVEILNRFQIRDAQIERIGWVLKAEMESNSPSNGLFIDSLGTALAMRLLDRHSSAASTKDERVSISGRKLRLVISYIEDNLVQDLSLRELASVAGVGTSQFKKIFRESTGMPVHRYVIERRVDRARSLLRDTRLPVARVAVEAGFAHQSHLSRHMRRMIGVTPGQLRGDYRE